MTLLQFRLWSICPNGSIRIFVLVDRAGEDRQNRIPFGRIRKLQAVIQKVSVRIPWVVFKLSKLESFEPNRRHKSKWLFFDVRWSGHSGSKAGRRSPDTVYGDSAPSFDLAGPNALCGSTKFRKKVTHKLLDTKSENSLTLSTYIRSDRPTRTAIQKDKQWKSSWRQALCNRRNARSVSKRRVYNF